jgi:hypothetical protein
MESVQGIPALHAARDSLCCPTTPQGASYLNSALVEDIARMHCAGHASITPIFQNGKNGMYRIDDKCLIRVSTASQAGLTEKLDRLAGLRHAPRLEFEGAIDMPTEKIYYLGVSFIPGVELYQVLGEVGDAQKHAIGKDIAEFMRCLHENKADHYDIGHYVPTIPGFKGSWRAGHEAYQEILREGLKKIAMTDPERIIMEEAFAFLMKNNQCLEFQNGPRLLHNDLHFKNIIIENGRLSGIIDWECSQYGEMDFELSHLIHWCLYPPDHGRDSEGVIAGIFQAGLEHARVPKLATRLAIYEIEHDMNQILWNRGRNLSTCLPRIRDWMAGSVQMLLDRYI